jgi:MFS transporter, SP family, sugar:H+ symporter
MLVCEFIVTIVGTAKEVSSFASTCLIVFVCIYIFSFCINLGSCGQGPHRRSLPSPIRVKGVTLSNARNWLWNFVVSYVTPYVMGADESNLRSKVLFVYGSTCALCLLFAYFSVPETKGLSLEQVDRMLHTTSRTSAACKPHDSFSGITGLTEKGVAQPGGVTERNAGPYEEDEGVAF